MMYTTTISPEWIANRNLRNDSQLRMFCFPYAGGSSLMYRDWYKFLPSEIEVVPIELPGRGIRLREKPYKGLLPLVEQVAIALTQYLNKPFVLFGHSMGALISFELARYLRRMGLPMPEKLFLSGHSAPHLPRTEKPIHNLPDKQFLEEIKTLNGTPDEVLKNGELMQLLVPVLKADFQVCETYSFRPEQPLKCPITAFGGEEDKSVGHQRLEEWKEHTESDFKLYILPGDHFFIQKSQYQLLQILFKETQQLVQSLAY